MAWLRTLLSGKPHVVIGDPPYLRRWHLVPRNRFLNVYLHQFLKSDDDRALHDHPWPFVSLVLRGGYYEHRAGGPLKALSWRPSGSLVFRRAKTLHRVELESRWARSGGWWAEQPCWTLVVTGPRIREWGFACGSGWRHWAEFVERGCE